MIILNFWNINATITSQFPCRNPDLRSSTPQMKFPVPAIAAACLLFPFSGTAELDGKKPAWMETITRLPPGDHADLRPVHLEYTLGWNNRVNAGEFEISVIRENQEGAKFVGHAAGRSTGFARILWPYDFQAQSIIEGDSLRPLTFQLKERERSAESDYDILFEPESQVYTTTWRRKDHEAKTATARFSFDFGQDVLSSAFYLRTQPLSDGDIITMVVTPFNKPYLARFTVEGREKRRIKGKKYDAIRIDATIGKVNGDLSIKRYEKIKKTTLWVSNDDYRIPLELQSDISFGFVSACLDDLNWLEE